MIKKCLALVFSLFDSAALFATPLDSNAFTRALENYSRCLNKTVVLAKQAKKTGNYEAYEVAMEHSDQAAQIVIQMINKIETQTEADVCKYLIQKFRDANGEHIKAAKSAKKMLMVKTNYLHATEPTIVRSQQGNKRNYIEVALEELAKEKASLDPRNRK